MAALQEESSIEARSVPNCMLCNHSGDQLYAGMKDHLFGASGVWSLKKCSNEQCGLVWLDPMPTEAEIGKAYRTYYTHGTESVSVSTLLTGVTKTGIRLLNVLAFPLSIPLRHLRVMASDGYLSMKEPGTLLEIGCGNGPYLDRMRSAGWKVEGVEVDEKAVLSAKKNYGLKIHCGTLDEVHFPDDTYDAIVLRHVIEHLHRPIDILKECYRVLKPGGSLVVITPNINSFGHHWFGLDWCGLDAPRHLHVFSGSNLKKMAKDAGFASVEIWTTPANAESNALWSLRGRSHRKSLPLISVPKLVISFRVILFQFLALLQYWRDNDSGDEVVLRGSK